MSRLLCVCTGDIYDTGSFGCDSLIRTNRLNALSAKIDFLKRYKESFEFFLWIDSNMCKYIDDRPILHFFDNIATNEISFFEFDFSWPIDGSDKQHIILLRQEVFNQNGEIALSSLGNLNNLNLIFHRNLCNKKQIYHIIGDSHSLNNYTDSDEIHSKCHILFDSYVEGYDLGFTHWIGARTMYSISKSDELQNLLNEFLVKPEDLIILSFGEIDVRAHVLKQSEVQGRDSEEIITELATLYIEKVKESLNAIGYKSTKVIISGVIPPINKRVEGEGQIETFGTIKEIVEASKYMNSKLKELCKNIFYYFDVYDEYSNPDGTLILEKSDYFCHISRYHNQLIHEKLNRLIGETVE